MADTASGLKGLATGPASTAAPKARLASVATLAGATVVRPVAKVGPEGVQVTPLAAFPAAAPSVGVVAVPTAVGAGRPSVGLVAKADVGVTVVGRSFAPGREAASTGVHAAHAVAVVAPRPASGAGRRAPLEEEEVAAAVAVAGPQLP